MTRPGTLPRQMGAALKPSMMRRKETKGWVRHDGSWPSLVDFPIPAGVLCAWHTSLVKTKQSLKEAYTTSRRGLRWHFGGLNSRPSTSDRIRLWGTIRVLTDVDGVSAILV